MEATGGEGMELGAWHSAGRSGSSPKAWEGSVYSWCSIRIPGMVNIIRQTHWCSQGRCRILERLRFFFLGGGFPPS
jgi:hypothetical protein